MKESDIFELWGGLNLYEKIIWIPITIIASFILIIVGFFCIMFNLWEKVVSLITDWGDEVEEDIHD